MAKNTALRAQLIATAIKANCDQYLSDAIDRDKWSDEQYRLWKMAERNKTLLHSVKMLLVPAVGR